MLFQRCLEIQTYWRDKMLPFKLTPDNVWVKTPYNEKDKVRNILNGVWSKKEGMYKFPRNIHAMRELMKMFPLLQADPEYIEAGKRMVAARNTALGLKTREDVDGDPRLRSYQRVDVAYLKKLPAALIANEPRTGKTPTSIILMKELNMSYDMKKFLVVAPASLTLNWEKEFETWYPNCPVVVVKGTPKKRKLLYEKYTLNMMYRPRVLIISKDTWKTDYEQFEKYEFDAVFVDEAHYLRNYDTAQSTAIMGIKTNRRYALTGTPTIKHTSDIFGILKFLYPTRFSSYWQFVERYFEQSEDRWGHRQIGEVKSHRKQELQEMIGFMGVQRKRQEVMPWLPPKQYISLYCDMDKKQIKLYDQMLNDFVAYIEGDDDAPVVDTANVLAQLMRLRQLCLDPKLLGFDVPSAKTNTLIEWLDNNREPVVIMSMFTSYFDILKPQIEKLGLKVGMIHGKMSSQDKETAKVEFQKGNKDVLLCNIISAGVGFTLDQAKVIIFTDKAWNPAENEQAEDRITPTTKELTHDHTVISLVIPGTVDERIHAILAQKKNLTDIVNEGGRNAIRKLLG